MDKLEQAVRKALAGLLLPPLQDIVLEYLPDRGTLEFDNTSAFCQSVQQLPMTLQPAKWLDYPRVFASNRKGHLFPRFHRKLYTFEPFVLRLGDLEIDEVIKLVTIVYQGEPEIVQIEWKH
jgi:hypothetical protein